MAGFTQGGYPPGCIQAMHDRAYGSDDTREECQRCDGTGKLCNVTGQRADSCDVDCEGHHVRCPDCEGTGYEMAPEPIDYRAECEQDEDDDVDF